MFGKVRGLSMLASARAQSSKALLMCLVISTTVSLLVHVSAVVVYWKQWMHSGVDDLAAAEFPIKLRSAALTTIKSPRLGLFGPDDDWKSLLPSGDGFVYLPSDGEHYIVSHYHQLHCIRALRTYFLARDNLTERAIVHVDHCLIYLHQMVLCNVDVTLEPATHKQTTTDGRVANTVTGVGVTHRCRDWAQLRDYMETNYEEWSETLGTTAAQK